MGRSSQRHKLAIRGYNSLGERLGLLKIATQHGTDSVSAILVVEGLWDSGQTATVNTDIGGGNVQSQYTPSGDEDANAAATGLAAIINGKADHTASATANQIYITKTTAGNVNIVNASVA